MESGSAPRAALWDMDGTLVDTAELHFAAWSRLFDDLKKPFTRDDFAATFGMRNPEIFAQLCPDAGFSQADLDELGERKENYYRSAAREQGVDLLPGARELLTGLLQAGFKQAVGTSAPRGNLDLILELTGAGPFFQAGITAEDTQRGKPDPQVFLLGAERLATPPASCVVFEDAPHGVEAGKAGGMKCVGITFVGHHSQEKLKAAGADVVVACLTEISADQIAALLL